MRRFWHPLSQVSRGTGLEQGTVSSWYILAVTSQVCAGIES
jgi:hypothetical protein